MKAIDALEAARAVRISLAVDGDDLVLEAASAPPAAVLDALSQNKAEIVALLRPGRDGWSAEDWQVLFDERAGIAEFDGGLPRAQAETQAFTCCVVEWLNRNSVRSQPGRCHHCGRAESAHEPLLPFGAETDGHAWLHSRCWPAWYAARKAEAAAALAAMGIAASVDIPDESGGKLGRPPHTEAKTTAGTGANKWPDQHETTHSRKRSDLRGHGGRQTQANSNRSGRGRNAGR
jgi:hypothetical protein